MFAATTSKSSLSMATTYCLQPIISFYRVKSFRGLCETRVRAGEHPLWMVYHLLDCRRYIILPPNSRNTSTVVQTKHVSFSFSFHVCRLPFPLDNYSLCLTLFDWLSTIIFSTMMTMNKENVMDNSQQPQVILPSRLSLDIKPYRKCRLWTLFRFLFAIIVMQFNF